MASLCVLGLNARTSVLVEKELNKKTFVPDSPSVEDLSIVLQLKMQHWHPVVKEIRLRLPTIWDYATELDENSCYEKLIRSFRNDSEIARDALITVAKRKKGNWERLLYLPMGAFTNGNRCLRLADRDQWDEINKGFQDRPIQESLHILGDALSENGRPEFKRVIDWLLPFYPDLDSTDGMQERSVVPDDPDSAISKIPIHPTETDWEERISEMRSSLEGASANPFDSEPLVVMSAVLDHLQQLVKAYHESLESLRQSTVERVREVIKNVKDLLFDHGDESSILIERAVQHIAESNSDISSDALIELASQLESKVAAARLAEEQSSGIDQAISDALAADKYEEAKRLIDVKKEAQSVIATAKVEVDDTLRRLVGGAGETHPSFDFEVESVSSIPNDISRADSSQEQRGGAASQEKDQIADETSASSVDSPGQETEDIVGDKTATSNRCVLASPAELSETTGDDDLTEPSVRGDSGKQTPAKSPGIKQGDPEQRQHGEPPPQSFQPETEVYTPPSDLFDYEAFCAGRWIAPDGTCQHAPWMESCFHDRLQEASVLALAQQRLAHLEIFSRALESRDQVPLIASADVRAIAEIWTQPMSDSAGGTDEPRLPRILQAARQDFPPEYVLIATLLELVKPSGDAPPTAQDSQTIVVGASIGSPELRTVVEQLLTFRQHGEDGWRKLLLQCRGDEILTDAQVLEQLQVARRKFQQRVQQLWSAAAGKIQRTHCRNAWSDFVENHIEPLLRTLEPSDHADDFESWDIGKLLPQTRKLTSRHAKIADRYEAKHDDRKMMDKATQEIAELASGIVQLAQVSATRSSVSSFHGVRLPLAEIQHLISDGEISIVVEEMCRKALTALVKRQPVVSAIGVTEADRWRFPDLLPLLECHEEPANIRWEPVVPVTVISAADVILAASVLLDASKSEELPADDMPRALRSRLIETSRSDLLPYLVGSDQFDVAEKTRIQRAESERMEGLNQKLRGLQVLRLNANALALTNAAYLETAYEQARSLLEERERSHRELSLIGYWLDALSDAMTRVLDQHAANFRKEVLNIEDADQRERVLMELNAGRFERALEGLHDRTALKSAVDTIRHTLWRCDVRQQFQDPLRILQESTESDEVGELAKLWLRQRRGGDSKAAVQLRRAFYDFISGEGELSQKRKRRIVPKELREIKNSQIIINCSELLKLFAREGLNPTFVPQLRDFSEIILMSPPQGVTPANAPKQLSSSIAAEREGRKLVIFLMPGLPELARERILAELRGRTQQNHGAVVDDWDLCRLFGTDADNRPQGMLGLIELAFEQSNWRDPMP